MVGKAKPIQCGQFAGALWVKLSSGPIGQNPLFVSRSIGNESRDK